MSPQSVQLLVDQAWKDQGLDDTQVIGEKELKPMLSGVLTKMSIAGPELMGTNFETEKKLIETDANGGISKEEFLKLVVKMNEANKPS